ncbi:MAG: AAA family ATPase [Muricoprocola sp.]
MGQFLNSKEPYDKFRTVMNGTYFVDKSEILEELIPALQQEQRFFCITRPRRFGKTVMANMIAAFFEKSDENSLFNNLHISKYDQYKNQVGQHDVIYIDFSEMPRECSSYREYITRIQDGLFRDIREAYPEINIEMDMAVWDILSLVFNRTGHKFIFVMDEWDAVFHMDFVTEKDRENYLLFLKLLLKGQSYVELAYMTGVLPIAKYSDGSELNMFLEYNMATRVRFSEYFGFSDEEVDMLYQRYLKKTKKPQITRESLREWYDGYHTAAGERLYNPRSVVCALTDNQISNYWVSSGKYDSIFTYIRNNIDEIQNDLTLLFAGEKIPSGIQEYAATAQELKTKEEIYSAMVVYGLLTYDNGMVFIPNKEIMGSILAAGIGYDKETK